MCTLLISVGFSLISNRVDGEPRQENEQYVRRVFFEVILSIRCVYQHISFLVPISLVINASAYNREDKKWELEVYIHENPRMISFLY